MKLKMLAVAMFVLAVAVLVMWAIFADNPEPPEYIIGYEFGFETLPDSAKTDSVTITVEPLWKKTWTIEDIKAAEFEARNKDAPSPMDVISVTINGVTKIYFTSDTIAGEE